MQKAFAVAAWILSLSAQSALAAAGAPPGWRLEGNGSGYFEVGTEQAAGSAGKTVAFIRSKSADPPMYAGAELVQRVEAASYTGKRLRLSTRLKTSDADDARCFMAIGSGDKVLRAFSLAHLVTGTTQWQDYDVVLDIPANADRIRFGFFLIGKGEVWADGFKLEPVGQDVAVSAQPLPAAPVNLNFDP